MYKVATGAKGMSTQRVTFPQSEDTWLLLPCGHYVRETGDPPTCHCEKPVKPETRSERYSRRKKARLEALEKKEVEAALNEPKSKPEGFVWRGSFRETT